MEAVQWLRKGAAQEHGLSQNNLGHCHETGQGVKQDYREAGRWFRKAAEQGNADAQRNLGEYYDTYLKDYSEAARWYRKAAEQNSAIAQNRLGEMYARGVGVPEDLDEEGKILATTLYKMMKTEDNKVIKIKPTIDALRAMKEVIPASELAKQAEEKEKAHSAFSEAVEEQLRENRGKAQGVPVESTKRDRSGE